MGERECEPANDDEAHGYDRTYRRARDRDSAERAGAILARLGRFFLDGFVAESHVTSLLERVNLGRSCRRGEADRARREWWGRGRAGSRRVSVEARRCR